MTTSIPSAPKPRIGVSTVVFTEQKVLLVQRGKEPGKGLWSLPGGSVEWGERLIEAALREVFEETALVINQADFCEFVEVLTDERHFVIAVFRSFINNEAPVVAGDDAAEAAWFHADDLLKLDGKGAMTPAPQSGFCA